MRRSDSTQWPRNAAGQEGAVLMIVLWVMIFLMVLASEFSIVTRTETRATANYREETEAYYAALAGIEQAKAELLSASGPVHIDTAGRLVINDRVKDVVRQGMVGKAQFSYVLMDEDRKLNINTLTDIELRYLLGRIGLESTTVDILVDAILDWRDPDSLHRLNGAEEDYYRTLTPPYSCKDAPFDSIDELLQVKGMSREILYGAKIEGSSGGIADLLSPWAPGALNVNTADTVALETKFGLAAATIIVSQRTGGPILIPVAGGITQSSVFTVTSTGTSGSMTRTVRAVLARKSMKEVTTLFWDDFVQGR